jgi:GTPase
MENFVDYVKLMCRSGKGGAGSAHFYRDGGNGGRGGHIILRGNAQMWTMLHLKYRKHIYADSGGYGLGGNCTGADGADIVLQVPLGTVAKDFETGQIMFEITQDGEQKILLPGGRGGMGNAFFKTSTNQTPRFAQPGEPEIEKWIVLEMKILADVGLVGFPNAGKSTLLASISAAKPEIADYPFTTVVPNLGIVAYRDYRSFVMADIPGIIEDAHLGKGLGLRFLRHIERNSVLLFMIPCDTERGIKAEFDILLRELELYNEELMHKPRVLAITKCDLIDEEMQEMMQPDLPEGIEVVFISAVAETGLMPLKDLLWTTINAE